MHIGATHSTIHKYIMQHHPYIMQHCAYIPHTLCNATSPMKPVSSSFDTSFLTLLYKVPSVEHAKLE